MLGFKVDSQPSSKEALEVSLCLLHIDSHETASSHIFEGLHLLRGFLNVGHTPPPVILTGGLYQLLKVSPLVPVELVPAAYQQGLLGLGHRSALAFWAIQ